MGQAGHLICFVATYLVLMAGLAIGQEPVVVMVHNTVDHEGIDYEGPLLDLKDIERIEAHRQAYPQFPMQHFLNAAYVTHGGLSIEEVRRRLKRIVRPKDGLGVHIHPVESLVVAAGVDYRNGPTYFGESQSPYRGEPTPRFPKGHRGNDVPLWLYTEKEIEKIFRFSLKTLADLGFTGINSSRTGAWMSDEKVLRVVAKLGLEAESSAVPPAMVRPLYGDKPLMDHINRLWQDITPTSQPYLQKISSTNKNLLIIPNNVGLADYVDQEVVVRHLRQQIAAAKPGEAIQLVYGYHLETAVEYMDRVDRVFEALLRMEQKREIVLKPVTFGEALPKMRRDVYRRAGCF
mgnify:CR=1 FL=1